MSYDPIAWDYEKMRNRPRRFVSRILIGAGLLVALGWAILFPILLPHEMDGIPGSVFVFPVVFGMFLSPFAGSVWGNRKLQKDEFEEQAANRATNTSFKIIVILAALLCFWSSIGISNELPSPKTAVHWSQWAWTFFILGAALPVLIAELIIPMPPKAELEEEE
jgi:hypothetical protein